VRSPLVAPTTAHQILNAIGNTPLVQVTRLDTGLRGILSPINKDLCQARGFLGSEFLPQRHQ